MKVRFFCAYLTNTELERRQQDWNAYWFIQALKGRPVNARVAVPILGQSHVLQSGNAVDVFDWFGRWAAKQIHPKGSIVPIPSSSAVQGKQNQTLKLATALQKHSPTLVVDDCLRWQVPQQPSHQGGPRDSITLRKNLVLTHPPRFEPIIVDDMLTSGGHMKAAMHALRESKPRCGLCGGRTVHDYVDNVFSPDEEEFDTMFMDLGLSKL